MPSCKIMLFSLDFPRFIELIWRGMWIENRAPPTNILEASKTQNCVKVLSFWIEFYQLYGFSIGVLFNYLSEALSHKVGDWTIQVDKKNLICHFQNIDKHLLIKIHWIGVFLWKSRSIKTSLYQFAISSGAGTNNMKLIGRWIGWFAANNICSSALTLLLCSTGLVSSQGGFDPTAASLFMSFYKMHFRSDTVSCEFASAMEKSLQCMFSRNLIKWHWPRNGGASSRASTRWLVSFWRGFLFFASFCTQSVTNGWKVGKVPKLRGFSKLLVIDVSIAVGKFSFFVTFLVDSVTRMQPICFICWGKQNPPFVFWYENAKLWAWI